MIKKNPCKNLFAVLQFLLYTEQVLVIFNVFIEDKKETQEMQIYTGRFERKGNNRAHISVTKL